MGSRRFWRCLQPKLELPRLSAYSLYFKVSMPETHHTSTAPVSAPQPWSRSCSCSRASPAHPHAPWWPGATAPTWRARRPGKWRPARHALAPRPWTSGGGAHVRRGRGRSDPRSPTRWPRTRSGSRARRRADCTEHGRTDSTRWLLFC